jgi:DNA-binding MarR family transcriptional regulator
MPRARDAAPDTASAAKTALDADTAPGTGGDPLELAPRAAEALHAATRLLAGVALRSLEALDAAVTLPQFRLLAVLADLGRVPSGRAARTLGLDPSTVTRLADRMVAAGHVTRGTDERHRGVVTLELTASGRRLVASAGDWRRAELARIMARLRPEDRAAVTTSLGLLVAAAGEEYGIATGRPVPL